MAVVSIAHLSDTHFGGLPGAAERTRRVLEQIAAMSPPVDVILVTGDIADHGLAEEYAEARETLTAAPAVVPMLLCPGNHDVRPAYRRVLVRQPGDGPVNTAQRVAGVLFLMCDSLVPAPPGERIDHGVLGPQTLAWLDEQLASRPPGERAVICLHHPPVDLHLTLMDPIKLVDADALAEVLGRHDGVVALLVGHAHTGCVTTFAGLPVAIPGGVASMVTLDAEAMPPITDLLPPMYAVHLLGDDGRLVSHLRALPG